MTRKLIARAPDWWPPEKGEGPEDFYVELPADDTFHIGQAYSGKAVTTLVCKLCGGREFNVGSSDFYTAIRCVKCEWETLVHDG